MKKFNLSKAFEQNKPNNYFDKLNDGTGNKRHRCIKRNKNDN